MSHYALVCPVCAARHDDDGLMLSCPRPHEPALLATEYTQPSLRPRTDEPGLFRYRDWLPVRRTLPEAAHSVVYRSEALGKVLGLRELWVAFSGYWPERGATLPTGTFKDLEAYTVLGRLPERTPTLVIASAGNTAAAFGRICSRYRVPCLIIVPGWALPVMRFAGPLDPCVQLVALGDDAGYADAIELAALVSDLPGYQAEGGVRNVARRDGLATAMLAAAETMGALPDYYVQAVGSAAGAIAAHEAASRIAATTGERVPRVVMCQNAAFAPIHDLWWYGAAPADLGQEGALAGELTNKTPPYQVRGGVRDVLMDSAGDVLVADAAATRRAMAMVEAVEGIDLVPGSGVAVASLWQAAQSGRVPTDARVLLHLTGGGRVRLTRDGHTAAVRPTARITSAASDPARHLCQLLEMA
ncbi:cysteate synthase [Actinokineospora sp. 24-640]